MPRRPAPCRTPPDRSRRTRLLLATAGLLLSGFLLAAAPASAHLIVNPGGCGGESRYWPKEWLTGGIVDPNPGYVTPLSLYELGHLLNSIGTSSSACLI